MTKTHFEELADRLTSEALQLLQEMAGAHLESTGDRLFMDGGTLAGGTHLLFTGNGSSRQFLLFTGNGSSRQFRNIDEGALEDLLTWGLLHGDHNRSGCPNYRVSGEGLRFFEWLMRRRGSAIDQVEQEVRRVTDNVRFAETHASAAHHLHEAFQLLWGGRTDEQVVSEIGDHLRKALMDATSDVVGTNAAGKQEKPIPRLEAHLERLRLPGREGAVVTQVVELARVVLRLDQRLDHIRDEADKGEPDVVWEEIRRAAFATSLACYELDRLRQR